MSLASNLSLILETGESVVRVASADLPNDSQAITLYRLEVEVGDFFHLSRKLPREVVYPIKPPGRHFTSTAALHHSLFTLQCHGRPPLLLI